MKRKATMHIQMAARFLLVRSSPSRVISVSQTRHLSTKAAQSVELTSERYPDVRRGNFSKLNPGHISFFESILGKNRVLTDRADVESYNVDWMKMVRGASEVVLKPKTTEEVSKILKFCNEENLAVCPQGGNTGLVGGSVPVFDEVILSTTLMNEIISIDEVSGVLVCQAGCILEVLDNYLSERGLIMPLDLGAKGSCNIGGNVSTNAGGIRLLRYGSLHGSVLGIEAVKADGEVIDCLSTLKKDNTGYHLKHLFIGSEGTLGVVTKVAIHCPPAPKAINLAFLGLQTFEDVLKTLQLAKHSLAEILSSCEMMDNTTMEAVTQNLKLKCPVEEYPFYMLIETSGSDSKHDEEKLSKFLEEAMSSNLVRDGTLTNEPSRIKSMWELRERMAEALQLDGHLYTCDVTVPLQHYYSLVPILKSHLQKSTALRISGFGHLGDGNLHLNVTSKQYEHDLDSLIESYVFKWTSQVRGSISAEHGIGFKKPKVMHYSKSQSAIGLMKQIKKLMDPKGILNPYKVLPE
ncbi:D-2-hydroxyglutarate dehydrogenase, mitochondrial isoform X1 [Schistocerca gregaria]|uniref:D-2-hydroxyglutarate dehydrogenase, mitochondrial isoform X1 n=2 Tax=Schistocerca gregaria TaxID=7010 RepID=UPI00211F0D8E|nr:D-2-hydroxyglutarate dehydrogenase, mitochondrial isoform X1 [Schistocerca gregaria]